MAKILIIHVERVITNKDITNISQSSLSFSSIETISHKIDTNIFRLVIEMSLKYQSFREISKGHAYFCYY